MLARVAAPAVWLLSFSGKAVLSLFGGGGPAANRVTEEEIKTLVAEAEGAGVLEPQERAMISAVLRLGDRPVRAVMTPRHEVDMIDIGDDAEMIRRRMVASRHTRLPVYDGEVDGVIGVVQAKDLLGKGAEFGLDDIRAMVRPAPIVPDSMDALDVVELFRETAVHIGLVHDEYGNFEGVITAADILELIVGELPGGRRRASPASSSAPTARSSSPARCRRTNWPSGCISSCRRTAVSTPSPGLVLAETGHLPEVCETVDIQGWRFEVVDLDGRRIDKLLVSRIAAMRRARA